MNTSLDPALSTSPAAAPTCSICLEDLKKDKITALACAHLFCTDCIEPWLKQQASCPFCRTAVSIPAATANVRQIHALSPVRALFASDTFRMPLTADIIHPLHISTPAHTVDVSASAASPSESTQPTRQDYFEEALAMLTVASSRGRVDSSDGEDRRDAVRLKNCIARDNSLGPDFSRWELGRIPCSHAW